MKKFLKKTSVLVGLLTFLAVTAFVLDKARNSNAALWTINEIQRDNSNFITSGFWNLNPFSGDIIKALYGSGDEGTAYTRNRSGYNSGSCLNSGMSVVYIPAYAGAGIDQIPAQLSGNTIYVLASGNHITSRSIELQNACTALAGNGNVKLYSNTTITTISSSSAAGRVIIDNIKIDGYNNGTGGSHTYNYDGIYLSNTTDNTINNIETYNNRSSNGMGLMVYNSSHNTLNNIKSYNNIFGIYVQTSSSNNILNNIQTYNNSNLGIRIHSASHQNSLNNIQTYNNGSDGVNIYGILGTYNGAINNILNNIQSYNNGRDGVRIQGGVTGTILNNIKLYNNSGAGIMLLDQSYENTYYGNCITKNNVGGGTSGDRFITGNTILALGRTTGSITTLPTTFNTDYITNAQNIDERFLVDTVNQSNLRRGMQLDYYNNNYITTNYTYGEKVLLQTQPVFRSGNNLITGGTFNSAYFVGGFEGVSGTIILPAWSNLSSRATVTRNFHMSDSMQYRIYGGLSGGDVTGTMAIYSGIHTKNINFLTGTNGEVKTVYVQYLAYNGNPTFAGTTTLDLLAPIFTGTAGMTNIISGGYYNTGVRFTFSDAAAGISGATIDETPYTSGTLFTTTGSYLFIVYDNAGNSTSTRFTIDTTSPTFTSNPAIVSGGYYNTSISYTGYDLNFSGITTQWTNTLGVTTGISTTIATGTASAEGKFVTTIYDLAGNTTGITFTIDKTLPVLTGTAVGGVIITGNYTYDTTSITLARSDTNLSGTIITLNGSIITSTNTLTAEGAYVITVTDKAGNSANMTFTLRTPLIGTISPWTGGTMINYNGVRYTNYQGQFVFGANKSGVVVNVTGDFNAPWPQPRSGGLVAQTFTLTTGDGAKFIYATFTNSYGQISQKSNGVILDTVGPTVANALPNNAAVGLSGDIMLGWTPTDTGIGASGAYYYISTTGTFATYVTSGYVAGITKIIPYYTFLTSGTYYWKIVGIDRLNNRGTTGDTRSFDCIATVDSDPDTFSFDTITDADIDTSYMSEIITITGITLNAEVPVSIDNGVLYISGIVVGRTGTVKQGNTIKIELISSSEYSQTVTSNLKIGSQTVKFKVKTATDGEGGSTLSSSTKLNIVTVFDTIADLYKDNKSRQVEFMIVFKSMLKDQIETMEDDNNLTSTEERKLAILKYLLDLTEQFIDDNNISDGDSHTAPNGKVYLITHDSNKACYTSPNFLSPNKCFPTLEGIKSYINANNLARSHTVDTTRKSVTYKAPSGKTYIIQKTTDNRYFSYRFISPKYYNSLQAAKDYINKNNPKGKGR